MSVRPALAALSLSLLTGSALARQPAAPPPPAAGAADVTPTAPRKVVTQHEGTFNGQGLRYTATVAETFLLDEGGAPAASATTIAYVRDGVADRAHRPVMFVFNGGPGASSSPLHMSALGPAIRAGSSSPMTGADNGWKPNPYSPIDAVDLVFIDPVGTGFSRLFPGADGKRFYSVSGDAQEVKTVIQAWLKANGREGSPRYLAGESYGTVRAPAIVGISKDLPFDGVLLIALVADVGGREMPFATSLPTMAAGAWFHNRIDRRGRTAEQVFDEAWTFARTDYVAALIQGASLAPAEKAQIAQRLSALIGLPADFIANHDLRIDKNTFMFNLLKDQGLRTGLLDVRVTGPLTADAQGGIDDPALGVAPKRAPGAPAAPPPTPESIGAVPSPGVARYLRESLKYVDGDPYWGVNFKVNSAWNYEAPRGGPSEGMAKPLGALAKAMQANPKLRLFWAGGYFDLTTPARAARYTLDQAGIPPGQLSAKFFAGPHGVYEGEENLKRFTGAVRDFVQAGPH